MNKIPCKCWALLLALGYFAIPVTATAKEGQRYAVVIGISHYSFYDPDKQLKFADEDARSFAAFIKTSNGGSFEEKNIRLLLNQDASHKNIFNALDWLTKSAMGNDVVYIFFAGHGELDRQDRAYFMPADGDPNVPGSLGFRADRFLQDLDEITAAHKVIFIDACHAGAALTADGRARGSENITPKLTEIWEKSIQNSATTTGFFSAAANQQSWEDPDLQHGLFTYYLIRGMEGKADEDGDGAVTVQELYQYLDKEVGDSSRKFRIQTPLPSPKFEGNFPLATVAPSPKIISDMLQQYASAVEKGDLDEVKKLRDLSRQGMEAQMSASLQITKGKGFKLERCAISDITPNSAKASCTVRLTRSRDTPPAKVTFFLERKGGLWRIAY